MFADHQLFSPSLRKKQELREAERKEKSYRIGVSQVIFVSFSWSNLKSASPLTPYGEDRTHMLNKEWPQRPNSKRFWIAGEAWCSASGVKGQSKSNCYLPRRTRIALGCRKKNSCVLILNEYRSYKTIGSSLGVSNRLFGDVIYSNGTSTEGLVLRNSISSMLSTREKNKRLGNRMFSANNAHSKDFNRFS